MYWNATKLVTLLLALCATVWVAVPVHAGEDADYRKAHFLYTSHEYSLAADALAKYLAGYPKSERLGEAQLLLAECHYQLKDYPKAGAAFARFIKDQPASPRRPEALQRAVKVFVLSKDYACGLESAEVFIKENRPRLGQKDVPPALPALYEQVLYYGGDAAYGLKQPDTAKSYWDALLKEFPASKFRADAAEGLGWLAFDKGDWAVAQNQFAVAAAMPNHPKAAASQVMVARCLDQLNKTDEALAALEKVPQLTGGKEQTRAVAFAKARTLLRGKRYEPAVAQCKLLAQEFVADAEAPVAVADACVQAETAQRPADALVLADVYLTAFPKGEDRPMLAGIKARALAAIKRSDEALAAARVALAEAEALPAGERRNDLERPAALMLLAELSGAAGGSYFETVVKDHGTSRFALVARYQLAYLAGKAGKLDEALAHAETLLKALPAETKDTAELRLKALFAAGDFAFRKPDYPRAETLLREYTAGIQTQAEPARAQLGLVNLRLAWCREHAQDPAGVVKLLDAALAAEPKGDLAAEMLYLRGLARLKLKDSAKALADFKQLLQDSPQSGFAAFGAFEAGRLTLETEKAEDALPWLDAALGPSAEPALAIEAQLLRAKARYKAGQFAGAATDAAALLKRAGANERSGAARLLLALALEAQTGKEQEAETVYGELIATGPPAAAEVRQAQLRRAQLRYAGKRFAEARDDYMAFLGAQTPAAQQPDSIQASIRLAVCLKELKEPQAAALHLERLSQLNLTGAAGFEAAFQLGNVYYEEGKQKEAASYYRKALDAAKEVKEIPPAALAAAWLNLAWSNQRAKDLKGAETAFGELLKLDPAGSYAAEARYHRGRLLAEAGNVDGAVALWQELLEKNPTDPLAERALAARADAQARAGRFVEAAADYEVYLKQYANEKGVREAWCGLAECRLQTKKPDGAREAFLKALGGKGLDTELDDVAERAVLGMAELALARGEAGESKKLALRVILDRPDSQWLDAALYLCGRSSEDLAEPEKAIGYYRKLVAERPQSARAETVKERLKALGAPASQP